MRDYYQDVLPFLGHQIIYAARTGRELVKFCRKTRPDLIISDIQMPEMDGFDAVRVFGRGEPIPTILVSAYHDAALIERSKGQHVLARLVKPIKQADLEVTISLAMRQFAESQALGKEAGEFAPGSCRPQIHRTRQGDLDEEGRRRREGGAPTPSKARPQP